LPSTRDIDLWKAFKILLVAPNGRGKTVAAASFHEAGPIVFHEFDGRMKPVKLIYPNVDIEYFSYGIDNYKQFENWLEDIQKQNHPPKWKTIVIDSITSLSMTNVMYQLTVKGKVKTGAAGLPSTSWDEINNETVSISKVLEVLKRLYERWGINVIVTAHPVTKTEIGDGDKKETRRTESLVSYGPKIGGIVPGYFDEIYRIAVRKKDMSGGMDRIAITTLTSTDDDILAKSALGIPQELNITNGLYSALMACKPKALSS